MHLGLRQASELVTCVPQENAQAQHPQLRHPEGVVPDSDAQALVAYLKLLAKVFREGSVPGEGSSTSPVIAWMHVLEEETGARPLWEVMFQLMCHPVPQVRVPLGFPVTSGNWLAALRMAFSCPEVQTARVCLELGSRLIQKNCFAQHPDLQCNLRCL